VNEDPTLADEDDDIEQLMRNDEQHRRAHERARVRFATLIHGQEDNDADDDLDDILPLPRIDKKPPPKREVKRAPPPRNAAPAKEEPVVKSRKLAPPPVAEEVAAVAPVPKKKGKKRAAVAPAKEKKAAAAPPPPQAKDKEEDPAPSEQAKVGRPPTRGQRLGLALARLAAFPSEDDLERCGNWVLLALYTMKICGTYPGYLPPEQVAHYALHQSEASFLYYRHLYMRKQVPCSFVSGVSVSNAMSPRKVAAAWQQLCNQSGNTDMIHIAKLMPHCKLFIDPKPKVYAQDAVCVWSGETTNLHPVALVPITEVNTMALGAWLKEPGLEAIQFHIGAGFKDILKCVHTLMFILDYVPFQIDAGKTKAQMHLKGEWCPEMEHELEEKVLNAKNGPLFAIRKSVCDLMKANMNAFRTVVGPKIADEFLPPFLGNAGIRVKEVGDAALLEATTQQVQ